MRRTKFKTVGWDLGGAHIKTAALDAYGNVIDLCQRKCPLWLGMDQFHQTMASCPAEYFEGGIEHALTMSGEMVDFFNNRQQGVDALLAAAFKYLSASNTYIFSDGLGLVKAEDRKTLSYKTIGSANWQASALICAHYLDSALLIDIGSTTADIVPVKNGVVDAVSGDHERLYRDHLVYTGVVRTPLMAVTQHIQFQGHKVPIMAEQFATMADVYFMTGELAADKSQYATADGETFSQSSCARRIARMIGRDLDDADMKVWKQTAFAVRESQLLRLLAAVHRQLVVFDSSSPACIIGAGVGRFLAKEIAVRLSLPYLDFAMLFPSRIANNSWNPADCACAVSVAGLLQQQSRAAKCQIL